MDEIKKSGRSMEFIADGLHISRQTLESRLTGKTEFRASEVKGMEQILNMTKARRDEIFFDDYVDVKSRKGRNNHGK